MISNTAIKKDTKMTKKSLSMEIEIPDNVDASLEQGTLKVKGPMGQATKNLSHKKVSMVKEDKMIRLNAEKATKREKAAMGSLRAHIKNLMKGVTQGHLYKLRICSGHFPMTVKVENKEISIKNLLGEKIARKARIIEGVDVKVEGDEIIVTGTDKGRVSQQASQIEELSKRPGFDRRIFQDGIYIIYKDGKEMR